LFQFYHGYIDFTNGNWLAAFGTYKKGCLDWPERQWGKTPIAFKGRVLKLVPDDCLAGRVFRISFYEKAETYGFDV
jgi:hypothetical protein